MFPFIADAAAVAGRLDAVFALASCIPKLAGGAQARLGIHDADPTDAADTAPVRHYSHGCRSCGRAGTAAAPSPPLVLAASRLWCWRPWALGRCPARSMASPLRR